jgi:hypothetical protein
MGNELDVLLSEPLGDVADGGFTNRVMLRIARLNARAARDQALLLGAATISICAVLPFTQIGRAINDWALNVGNALAMPLAIAFVTLVASRIVAQMLPD